MVDGVEESTNVQIDHRVSQTFAVMIVDSWRGGTNDC